jgi:Putative methyltransferase
VNATDWVAWHDRYDRQGGVMGQRLALVQAQIKQFLDERKDEELRVISICAGDGRDVLGVLAAVPEAKVHARLLELDETNVASARQRAAAAGCADVDVVRADASSTEAYVDAAPADLVLVCGVFGNVAPDDIRRTIRTLPQLCASNAWVIWTRHRGHPDLTPTIRSWFADEGFVERSFDVTTTESGPGAYPVQAVGVHMWPHAPHPLRRRQRMFTFFR